jgi:perosamine synthetase
MNEKKIRWFYPQFDEKEEQAVSKVIASGYINDGEITVEFEKKIASFLGCKHCVAVTSGTAAIALSLMALGVGVGDEVIVPDFTFIATANAARLAGASVKLVDIEKSRFTIDPSRIREAITPRTKAIIPVDVNGRGADYDAIEAIAKEFGLFVVCDSAEALGSKYKGKYLGTFGHAGCFSFSANKTVSSGQGGMIATNDSEVYHKLKELKDQGRRFGGTGGNDLHPAIGYNFKYTNLLAAVALVQFEKMDKRIEHFQMRDQWYQEALQSCPEITLPPLSTQTGEIRQWTDLLFEERLKLEKAFQENLIECRPFWFPLHRQKPYFLEDAGFENSIEVSRKGLWLPSSFDLTKEDAIQVSRVVHQVTQTVGVL